MVRRCFIVMAFSWAASSLMLTGAIAGPVPPQTEEQSGGGSTKESSSVAEAKDTRAGKKIVTDPDSDFNAAPAWSFKGLGKEFLLDQEQIWTSPAKLQFSDTQWLVPLSGITAGLFVTDTEYSRHLSHNPTTISHSNTLSNAGIGALIGGAGGVWVLGHVKHNEHWSETGFLAGEAALNSLITVESLKYSLGRERPYQGNGTGPFFQGGTSFPSEHAAAAWSVAGVIAHEYSNPFVKIAVYGLASLVDYSRIHGRQHFPSDVFVGSMMGNLIAQNIYTRNHDPGLGGEAWKSLSAIARGFESSGPQNLGSPNVPLDSWVYPVLDRLAGLGLIDSSFEGLRPWTRRECMRQLNEAEENLAGQDNSEAQELLRALQREFDTEVEATGDGDDRGTFRVESVYSRTEKISGAPLTDGYTFAQTQINDFGRPYGEGINTVNGFSSYASRGPWVVYVRGEEQSSPSIPAYSLATREVVQQVNTYPGVPLGTPEPSMLQFKLLDAYFGLMFSNWQVTFGKQSLSWGPGDGGSLTLSNNAQPINMFRISRTTPLKLSSFLGWLGPIRTEFFLGQLAGYEFILSPSGIRGEFGQSLAYQPLIHGQKLSFRPTRNFEFGVFRTTIFGGEGYPFTLHALETSLFTTGNSVAGSADKPGKRTSGLDLNYRLPYMRNWLSFYADGLAYDQFSPIAYADRSAWRAGLYLSHFPVLPKLDLRVEGVYTDNPLGGNLSHGFYYYNATWKNGYTNNGYIIGNWIGREGQGAQAWMNYWFKPKNRFQVYYRHQKVSQEFIPGGGTLTDVGLHGDVWTSSELSFSANVQYETWTFPVIRPGQHTDVSASLQATYWPKRWKR
jgi:capsule assembly protein Wzi/PAP2 superfamily protein